MEFKFLIGMIEPYGYITDYIWLNNNIIEVSDYLYVRSDAFMEPIDNNGITFYSNGNVGIGTTNPQRVLDVDSNIAITSGVRITV